MGYEDQYRQAQRPKYDSLLFDLDDTLHPLSTGLAAGCCKNIGDYMVEKLGIDKNKIPELSNLLYKNYGTTMAGLRAIGYDFDYDDYHSFVHGRLPYENLKPDPVLRSLLLNLPIRKVIYVIKMNIHCECYGCQDKLEGYRKILGVKSVYVDDEEKKVTILIIGDPKKVIEKLEEQKKAFELFEQTSPIKNQEMQIVLQNPVPKIHDRRMVAQQPALEIDKSIVKKTQGCCPEHGYKLEKKSYNKGFTCDGCKEKGRGSGYRCEHCDYVLHEECMSPEHSISPEIFPRSTFEFCHQPSSTHPRSCDACGNYIKGYLYACNARNLALHPCCSNLKANLCIGGMDFILHNKVSSSSKCKRRNQKTPKTRNPGCSYVSTCNKYHFHVYCITQMVHEAWTNGDIDGSTDDFAMTLEKKDPVETKNRNGGSGGNRNGGSGGNNIWRTISIFISTIAACLLGDPTGVLVPFILGFFIKSIPKLLPKLN